MYQLVFLWRKLFLAYLFPSANSYSLDTLLVYTLLEYLQFVLHQNVYIFWCNMFFKNIINIYLGYYFLHMAYQSASPETTVKLQSCLTSNYWLCHYSPTSSSLINLISLSLSSLESSDSSNLVSKFLVLSCRYLDLLNAGYGV